MEEDIQNNSSTVMFCGTPCIRTEVHSDAKVARYEITQFYENYFINQKQTKQIFKVLNWTHVSDLTKVYVITHSKPQGFFYASKPRAGQSSVNGTEVFEN